MKKLLIGLIVGLALVIAALLALPGWIDWTRYRTDIAAELSDSFGHPVAIDGEIAFAALPAPHLTVHGLRVVAPAGAAYPNMARATTLDMQVQLLPLLGGRLVVERLALAEPVLVIERLADGSSNWQGAPGEGLLARLAGGAALQAVAIEDGTIIRHQPDGTEQRITGIAARLGADTLAGPFELDGRFTFARLPWAIELRSGQVTAAGALPVQATLELEGVAGELHFAGLAGPDLAVQGDVTATGPDLGPVLATVLRPEAIPGGVPRPFTAHAAIRATPARTDLTALAFDLGEVSGTGSIAVAGGEAPRAEITLAISRLNLDSWLGPPPWRLPPVAPDQVAAFPAAMGNWTGRIELAIEALESRGGVARQVRLNTSWGAGTLSVDRLSAQLPGSSALVVAGRLRVQDGSPAVELHCEGTSSDLRGLLGWLDRDPAWVPAERLRRLALAFTLSGTLNDFQLTGLDATIDTTRLTGALAYRDRGRPGVGLRFDIDRLDLDSYGVTVAGMDLGRLVSSDPIPAGSPEAQPGDSVAPAPWLTGLTRFDANIDGRVGALTLGGLPMQDLRLDAAMVNGGLTLRRAAIGAIAGAAITASGSAGILDPLDHLDVTVEAAAPAAEPIFRALGVVSPVPPEALGALSLTGHVRRETADHLGLALTLGAAGGTVEIGGTVARSQGAVAEPGPAFALAVRARHPDLAALVRQFTPGYRPASEPGALDLYARVEGTPRRLIFDQVQGVVGAVPVAGRVTLDRVGARPALAAELRTGTVDFDRLLPPRRAGTEPDRRWSAAPVDLSALEAVDGTLAVTMGGVHYGGLRIADPALRAELHGGVLTLNRLSGRLFDGTLGLSGRLAVGTPTALRVEADLVGARLDQALATTFATGGLSGALDVGITAEATGNSPATWIAGLTGRGLIAVRDGTAMGIDLDGLAAGLDQPGITAERLRRAFAAGRTPFAALNAPFVVEHGVVRADQVRLATAVGIGQGSASYDIAADRLDATIGFGVHNQPEAPPIALRLSGSPAAPERTIDVDALPAFLARRATAGPSGPADPTAPAAAAGSAAPAAPSAPVEAR